MPGSPAVPVPQPYQDSHPQTCQPHVHARIPNPLSPIPGSPRPCQAHCHTGVPNPPSPVPGSPVMPAPWPNGCPPNPASPMDATGSPTPPAPRWGPRPCQPVVVLGSPPPPRPVPDPPVPSFPPAPGLTPALGGPEDAVGQDDGGLQVGGLLPPQRLVAWQPGARKAALVQPHHRHHCGTVSPRGPAAPCVPGTHSPWHPWPLAPTVPGTHGPWHPVCPARTPAPTGAGTQSAGPWVRVPWAHAWQHPLCTHTQMPVILGTCVSPGYM